MNLQSIADALPTVPQDAKNDVEDLVAELFPDDNQYGPEVIRVLREHNCSISQIRHWRNNLEVKKCMSCPCHCKDRQSLLIHMKQKKHYYGVNKLNELKEDFISRLNINHPDAEFKDIHGHYVELADFEKAEYCELLYLTLLQIRFR